MGQRYHVAVGAHTQCMHFQKYTPMDLFNVRNKVHEDEVSKSSDFDWEENNLVTFLGDIFGDFLGDFEKWIKSNFDLIGKIMFVHSIRQINDIANKS